MKKTMKKISNDEKKQNFYYPLILFQTTNPPIQPLSSIYVTKDINSGVALITEVPNENSHKNLDKIAENFERFSTIIIPSGIKRELERLPRELLKKISKNRLQAIELCLLVIYFLVSTSTKNRKEWKSLHSDVLHENTKIGKDNTRIYPAILEALKYTKGNILPIIEVKLNNGKETYQDNYKPKQYKLHTRFYDKKIVQYEIADEKIIEKRKAYYTNQIEKVKDNSIAKNLLAVYPRIKFPSNDELLKIGRALVKSKFKTKKGKILKLLNKMKREDFKNHKNISFVEENIKQFNRLMLDRNQIPKIGNENSGGRIVDKYTLMPSWIRNTLTIDGEKVDELDFKAFHVNLAINIYQGNQRYLTHQKVAENLNMEVLTVKTNHLSFFNSRIRNMKQSKIYNFYNQNDPIMLKRIFEDKKDNDYKSTTYKMFALEVKIMTEIIEKLNSIGIQVVYVYDALLCKKSDSEKVRNIMNDIALKNHVYTIAEISK